VNVLCQFRQTRDRVDQIIAETNGMRGGKPKPFEPGNFIHCFQQLHKGTFAVALRKFVTAVEIYNLPK
jgi:hypothetical protein